MLTEGEALRLHLLGPYPVYQVDGVSLWDENRRLHILTFKIFSSCKLLRKCFKILKEKHIHTKIRNSLGELCIFLTRWLLSQIGALVKSLPKLHWLDKRGYPEPLRRASNQGCLIRSTSQQGRLGSIPNKGHSRNSAETCRGILKQWGKLMHLRGKWQTSNSSSRIKDTEVFLTRKTGSTGTLPYTMGRHHVVGRAGPTGSSGLLPRPSQGNLCVWRG